MPKIASLKNIGGAFAVFHSSVELMRKAGATFLFLTRTSKSSFLKRVPVMLRLLQEGTGVAEGVGVTVGVSVAAGVGVSVGIGGGA